MLPKTEPMIFLAAIYDNYLLVKLFRVAGMVILHVVGRRDKVCKSFLKQKNLCLFPVKSMHIIFEQH